MRPEIGLVRLLLRAGVVRRMVLVATIASLVSLLVVTTVGSLDLTVDQKRTAEFGGTVAAVQTAVTVSAGRNPDRHPDWLSQPGLEWWPVLKSNIVLGAVEMDYEEVAAPSPVTEGRMTLIAGAWPTRPGHCVASDPKALTPSLGVWPLSSDGRIRDEFQPRRDLIVCAAGTWALWRLGHNEQRLAPGANLTYYLSGDATAIASALRAASAQSSGHEQTVSFRSDVQGSRVRPTDIVGEFAPMLALVFGGCAALGAALGVWAMRVCPALVGAGVRVSRFFRVVAIAAVSLASLAALVGSICGNLIAYASRPGLSIVNGGAPLSPHALQVVPAAGIILTSALAVACGLAWSWRNKRTGEKGVARSGLSRIGAVVVVLALGMVFGGGESLWLLLPSGIVAVIGACLCFPAVAKRMARGWDSKPVGAALVASRLLSDMSRKVAAGGIVLTLIFGLWSYFLMLLITNSASQRLLMQANMPAGLARISLNDENGVNYPSWVIQQFEHDVGVSHSTVVVEAALANTRYGGVLWAFESPGDVVNIIHGLSADEEAFLVRGGVLTTSPVGDRIEATRVADGGELSLPARQIDSSIDAPDVPGFVLQKSLGQPASAGHLQPVFAWRVYGGLTPSQDALARDWLRQRGYANIQVEAHYGVDWFVAPISALAALVLLGAASLLITRTVLSELAVTMRPALSTLRAVGAQSGFGRAVLARVAAIVTGSSLALASAAVLAVLASLYVRAPTAFTIEWGQWWLLPVYISVVVASSLGAMLGAVRRLSQEETLSLL